MNITLVVLIANCEYSGRDEITAVRRAEKFKALHNSIPTNSRKQFFSHERRFILKRFITVSVSYIQAHNQRRFGRKLILCLA